MCGYRVFFFFSFLFCLNPLDLYIYLHICICRNFEKPARPSDERLHHASREFYAGIITNLKGKSQAPFYVSIEMDMWRYVSFNKGIISNHRGHKLYQKDDFSLFRFLPNHWWYWLNKDGEGQAVDFPLKIKPVISWTLAHHIWERNKLMPGPRMPLEKLYFTHLTRVFTPSLWG